MSRLLKILIVAATFVSVFAVLAFVQHSAVAMTAQPGTAQSPSPLAPNAVVTITILHTNDFHGQLEALGSCTASRCDSPGIAKVSTVISQVRASVGAANVLLVDAGDEMQGSLLSNLKKGQPTIDLFNFLGYQAATLGNHEFDWGQQVLISRTQQANYPFVAANLVVSDTGSCGTSGWTVPSFVKPWITMTVGAPGNQAVVGLLGVASIETPYITIASATEGLCFKDPADSIQHYYSAVKAAGADVIVVLSHNGFNDGGYGYGFTVNGDKTLATKLYEKGTPVDLIIGGHSHTDITTTVKITNTLIVQASQWGRKVGREDLVIDTNADTVITSTYQSLPTWNATPDVATSNYLSATWTSDPAYQAQIGQVIGYSYVDLVRDYNGDNFVGDLVNDAVYNDLNTDGDPANDVDIVFNNPGGLRSDLTSATKPFTLTYGMMFSILPFGNATTVGTMTGAQIQDLLNQSATLFKGALQVSGIRYKFYRYSDALPGPQPYAWGAYDIVTRNRNTGLYEPLVMTKTYRIGTNEFLAPAGQDGFIQFKYVGNSSYTYWGDMLNQVNHWISMTYSTPATAYKGPNGNGLLDGRIIRNGTDTYNGTATEVVPVTVLHHNDAHGRLLDYVSSGTTYPGYTRLATLIKQERTHNPTRTILLNAGDTIQGDAMAAYYKAAYSGFAPDGTALPITLTVNPILKAMNALTYTAMTLGNHEFNYGNAVFVGTLGQATFPLLQANVYDAPWPYNIYLPLISKGGNAVAAFKSMAASALPGIYGLGRVNLRSDIAVSLPGPAGNVKVAILGIGNHRVPNYELPSNIPGLTFTNPVTETQTRAPALKAANDAVIALTHIGFTDVPGSLEVDNNVDTYLAANSTGVDAIIGGHSHTNPSAPEAPYKFLPTFVGASDNTPVIINQAYRYNSYLGEVVLGLLPKAGGGYTVVSRAGRYIANTTSVAEDAAVKAIIQPYDAFFQAYKNRTLGRTTAPIDTTNAFITETNGADMQVDASLYKLNTVFGAGTVMGHLSGAMTNAKIASSATTTNPVTMTVNDMFTLMPYENSLVVYRLNGPQLKTILERAYRNYWYYKTYPTQSRPGGYDKYTTCMLDIDAGGIITYTNHDPLVYTTTVDHVGGLSFGGVPVDFLSATTYYTVSTVNYIAAGSCNFNNGGVTLWPFNQIVHDTQYYVRDVMIDYVPTLPSPITPTVGNRIRGIP